MNTKIKVAMAIAAAAAAASAATLCQESSVNTALWFNGSDQQVATGGDMVYDYMECTTTTMGYWYDYDDRKNDKGGSFALYPYDTTGYYGSLVAPEIENLGYAAIAFKLVDPSTTGQTAEYPYNFVGFGFNLVDGAQDPMDISAAGGLCATYTTDLAVTLEVANATAGDASCNITLTKASAPTMVSKTIADFKQPTWATGTNKLSSCADAFAAATAVKFKLDGGASDATGILRVFQVGPAGTCTTSGAIGAEPSEGFCYKSDGNGHATLGSECIKGSGVAIGAVKAAASVKASYANHVLSISGLRDAASYEIVSLQGQVVKSGIATSSINLSSLNAGVYMVRVAGNTVNMTQKILVK